LCCLDVAAPIADRFDERVVCEQFSELVTVDLFLKLTNRNAVDE
jgi:hypothetical protein